MKEFTLSEHIHELRNRVIIVLCSFILFFITSYIYHGEIFDFLSAPLRKVSGSEIGMIYTNLSEAFCSFLKLSAVSAIFFTVPVLAFQVYRFIVPALHNNEKRFCIILFLFSMILFYVSFFFTIYFVLPKVCEFFLSFQESDLKTPLLLNARISQYIGLTSAIILGFMIAFQFPIAIIFMKKLGIINNDFLSKNRRFAIVIIFIIAAILTPPDVFSQIALALPLILLYEVSVLICKFIDMPKR